MDPGEESEMLQTKNESSICTRLCEDLIVRASERRCLQRVPEANHEPAKVKEEQIRSNPNKTADTSSSHDSDLRAVLIQSEPVQRSQI